ncbi:MAG TPA: MBL fold metallo-hydrolase [Mycobacteriales bacterium]|nr:MBL fold metallo-hydrolase [Mycobacteriales bacterium]
MTTPGLRHVTPTAGVVLAPNPGPMTLEGTNTWVLQGPGREDVLVVDPGPLDEGHLERVASTGDVSLIVLTHGHYDHSEGARRLHEMTGAHVLSLDPSYTIGGEALTEDGEVFGAAGVTLRLLHTPGHSSDSVSLYVEDDPAVLTGDTILGRGTTVVAHPDGVLRDYLRSLERLRELGDVTVLPGHGPELPHAGVAAQQYLDHREQRLEQVRAAVGSGARTAREVVETVYADVDRVLWPAAELSVRAQLDFLGVTPGSG